MAEALEKLPDDKELMIELKGCINDYRNEDNLYQILDMINSYNNKKLFIHGFNHELLN